MSYSCWFQCFNGCCDDRYSIYDVIYRCPKCDGLLEVAHDVAALKEKSAQDWKDLFDQRAGGNEHPYGSGVWAYKEWVVPTLDPDNVVSTFEGNSNLYFARSYGEKIGLKDLWVKQCGNSHTGSFKDLGMTVLVSVVNQMMQDADSPVKAVAAASTGDTSAALAAYAAAADIPSVVFLPDNKVSPAQLIQPTANGAHVLALDTDFDGCMDIVRQVTQDNSVYLANSMNSLRIEGQKTVGFEIVRQFNWEVPDWIIIPVGNLGNISALYKGLKLMMDLGLIDRMPRLVAAQAEHANPFYRSYKNGFADKSTMTAEDTQASAIRIGNPVSYDKAVVAVRESNGIVEQANEQELSDAAAMGDLAGMYNCPHTGVALAVLNKLVDAGTIKSDDRVVVISTAHGLKFTSFKTGYHAENLPEVESKLPNPAVRLPANADAVKATLAERLGA